MSPSNSNTKLRPPMTDAERLEHTKDWASYWGWTYFGPCQMFDIEPDMVRSHQHRQALAYRRARTSVEGEVADLKTVLIAQYRCLPPAIWRRLDRLSTLMEVAARHAEHNCTLQEAELSYLRGLVWGIAIGDGPDTLAPIEGEQA